MHVLIPAGGRGVRLRPLTDFAPKPLLPLAGVPILERIIGSLPAGWPVTILITPEVEGPFRRWIAGTPLSGRVDLYVERPTSAAPRGPVVAIQECVLAQGIDDALLVLMGDSILPFSLVEFVPEDGGDRPRIAAYELPDGVDPRRFGVVEAGRDGRLLTFEEKPDHPRSRSVFTGCFTLPRRLLPELRVLAAEGLPQMGHLIARFLATAEPVDVFTTAGQWYDIGTFRAYIQAHQPFISTDGTPATEPALTEASRQQGVVYVGPGARVLDSDLRDTLVGEGATVTRSRLCECVVHPGTEVADRTATAILFTPGGELPLEEVGGS